MDNEIKECEYYCTWDTDTCRANSRASITVNNKCTGNPNCYYKQLLAEQAKNSELDATLKILKINHKLTISELNNEQAKNKKLVDAIEVMCHDDWEDMTVFKFQKQMVKALNEVNK